MNDPQYLNTLSKYLDYKSIEARVNVPKDAKISRELESRFEVDYQIADILKYINELQEFQILEEESDIEFHEDKYRKIIYKNPPKVIEQYKIQLSQTKINLQGYPITIAYSHEIETPIKQIENPKKKTRKRYIIKNFFGNELNLTSTFDPFQKRLKNEIEIEYNVEKLRNIDQIIYPIKYLFDLLYVKSMELLSPRYMIYIIQSFNSHLSKLKPKLTEGDRNNMKVNKLISYEDKPISMSKDKVDEVKTKKYFVTNKLNGTRYYLFITNGEFYLIGKTGSKFSTVPTLVWKLFSTNKIDPRDVFIMDGEYFNNDLSSKLYYTFDILLHKNEPVNNLSYDRRLFYLKKFTDYINSFSPIKMKYIIYGDETYSVIENMKKIFKNEWDYDNDGLIYTYGKSIYADHYYKTLKWKFEHHQSVDVQVKHFQDNYYICYVGDYNNKIIQFTDYYLYSSEKLKEDSIVEVVFDVDKKQFYPLRLRPDKDFPNFKTTAESVFQDIIDPIPLNALTKRELYLTNMAQWKDYRKKSNLEKDKLIQEIDPNSLIIDIGFGKGGDILKYVNRGVTDIIGIEPNFQNIEEFFTRYNVKFTKNIIMQNEVIVKDKKINVIIIHKSAVDPNIVNIVTPLIKEIKKPVTVCAFFSLTYFFNPLNDFVRLFYYISYFYPFKIIGTVMDGEKTINFLNNFDWNSKNCGLELRLIKNKNVSDKIYIRISDSATVQGHYEYLCQFNRLKEYIEWYKFKLTHFKFFDFYKDPNNLLTHFSSLNCSFIFSNQLPLVTVRNEDKTFQIPSGHINTVIQNIINYNEKLALPLDSEYFYNAFVKVQTGDIGDLNKKIHKFFENKNIENYSIDKELIVVDDENEKLNYKFLGTEVDYSAIDPIRYFLLMNTINKNFKTIYEVPINDDVKYKIFYDQNKPFQITNLYFDYYTLNPNDTYEVLNLIKQHKSPIKNYKIIEYNGGIGNYTILFAKYFKDVIVIENNFINYQISKHNLSLYYNIISKSIEIELKDELKVKIKENDKEVSKNITYVNNFNILDINHDNKSSLFYHDKTVMYNYVLFVNYQFFKIPSLEDIKKSQINGLVIILTPEYLDNLTDFYDDFTLYKLQNSYLYFINQ
jgi:hypothetical protein